MHKGMPQIIRNIYIVTLLTKIIVHSDVKLSKLFALILAVTGYILCM